MQKTPRDRPVVRAGRTCGALSDAARRSVAVHERVRDGLEGVDRHWHEPVQGVPGHAPREAEPPRPPVRAPSRGLRPSRKEVPVVRRHQILDASTAPGFQPHRRRTPGAVATFRGRPLRHVLEEPPPHRSPLRQPRPAAQDLDVDQRRQPHARPPRLPAQSSPEVAPCSCDEGRRPQLRRRTPQHDGPSGRRARWIRALSCSSSSSA
mmetsp:Transcript_37387/g.99580  ORF Transcript_37387/g.99580 Transcript_37387/m.99580 type:complete len:207 (-) Transcript_37387:1735-2355(-)